MAYKIVLSQTSLTVKKLQQHSHLIDNSDPSALQVVLYKCASSVV